MATQLKRSYCTDATWLGRSDCKHCSIRNLMLFSGLPDSAFEDHLAPVDHFIFPAGSTLFREGDDDAAVFFAANQTTDHLLEIQQHLAERSLLER